MTPPPDGTTAAAAKPGDVIGAVIALMSISGTALVCLKKKH